MSGRVSGMTQAAQEEIDGDDSFSNLGVGALLLFQSEIEVNRLLKGWRFASVPGAQELFGLLVVDLPKRFEVVFD